MNIICEQSISPTPAIEKTPVKGVLFYTDNCLNMRIARKCREYIKKSGLPITSVSLKPMDFGKNIHFKGERSKLTMFRQILAGLEAMTEDIIFLCEHDVIYHQSHFDFIPEKKDVFYYNENSWRIREDGLAVYFDHDSTSQLCAYRELLITEYRERVRRVELEGFHGNGYEPGTRSISRGGFSDSKSERWRSIQPNIDIRHDNNLTPSRWKQSEFRDQTTCQNWQESTIDKLWIKDVFKELWPTVKLATKYDLSIIIPARNEEFLNKTIEDILLNMEGNTEIIVVLDGCWANPPIKDNPRITIIHHSESIGQRASCNEAVKLSNAKYVMKSDAHCAFDKGFDIKMMAKMHDDWTMVPIMRNLHAFDWVCPEGHRRYQSPSGVCTVCGKETTKDIVWIAKTNPQSTSYCFDTDLHFQYFREYKKKQIGDLVETMSLQGSCFLMTREKYWELNVCDERHGSWGQQGVEVALATWLSGGRIIVNKKTWYAHMFRTAGGDFGFPYPNPGIEKAREYSKDLWLNNKHRKQIYPLSWLIEKFWSIPNWSNEDLRKIKEADASFMNKGTEKFGVLGVVPTIPSTMTNHTTPMSPNGSG